MSFYLFCYFLIGLFAQCTFRCCITAFRELSIKPLLGLIKHTQKRSPEGHAKFNGLSRNSINQEKGQLQASVLSLLPLFLLPLFCLYIFVSLMVLLQAKTFEPKTTAGEKRLAKLQEQSDKLKQQLQMDCIPVSDASRESVIYIN